MDPYHFDEENSNFFSLIKNMILKTIFLLFKSFLFIYNQKRDLFLTIFLYFWSFFSLPGSVPDPFSHFTIRNRDPFKVHFHISRYGSGIGGSGQMIRIRPDPDPQYCENRLEAKPKKIWSDKV